MANFFINERDLMNWVLLQKTPEQASSILINTIKTGIGTDNNEELPNESIRYEQDIYETCKTIFKERAIDAAEILYQILAEYDLVQNKETLT
jgi:hypothetical protein